MTEKTLEERRRRQARERKQRERERRKAMQMQDLRLHVAAAEREEIESTAMARGFEDVTEYLVWLVRADRQLMEIDPRLNPAAEAVTRHVREFSARCDTPEINGADT